MAEKKKASAVTGIDKFYYAILKEDNENEVIYGDLVRVPYIQNVSIETEQEIAKSYGDNSTAEMAVATGVTSVELQFNAIPLEDRAELLGLENSDGTITQKSQVQPPYVAIVLEKTLANGTVELVGLTKGMFTLPALEAQTREDSLEFGNDTISGEFSARTFDDVTQIMKHIDKDGEEDRKEFMNKVFQNAEGNDDEGKTEE